MDLGQLLPEPMEKTVAAVTGFCGIAASWGVERVVAVATSSVRDAANRKEFLEMIRQRADLDVRVISGDEEAILSYRGVLAGLSLDPAVSVVLDVGGGSTELIWQADGQIQTSSVQVGAVRFTVNNWSEEHVVSLLAPVLDRLKDIPVVRLAGVGGTITSLAAMEMKLSRYDPRLIHGFYLTSDAIEQLYGKLLSLSLEERKIMPGLQPARADIITGGTAIVRTVLRQTGLEGLTVSESDILQGLLLEMVMANGSTGSST